MVARAGKGAPSAVSWAPVPELYGVNDNRKHDAAYSRGLLCCMRSRGYAG